MTTTSTASFSPPASASGPSNASPENTGFHWNALCVLSWGQLAELYLRAKAAARKGDTSLLQQFYQKRLGLPWREYVEDYKLEITRSGCKRGETMEEGAIDPRIGAALAAPLPERKGLIPRRFLAVDCQIDHLFLLVRSWSADGSSRLLEQPQHQGRARAAAPQPGPGRRTHLGNPRRHRRR